jgi:SpoVK/Ycf46/Vps4 family AAA+-type ATPase
MPAPVRSPARGRAVYLLCALGLMVGYLVTAPLLWVTRDFAENGPLSFGSPAATAPLDPQTSLDAVRRQCLAVAGLSADPGDTVKLVAARSQGTAYYACYLVRDGRIFGAAVVDAGGMKAPDLVTKRLGAWPYIGLIKTVTDLVLAGFALAVVLVLYYAYYRRARPGPPVPARWWQTAATSGVLGTVGLLPLTLPFRRGESRARRVRLLFRCGFGWTAALTVVFLLNSFGDRMGTITLLLLGAGQVFGWQAGRALLRPATFGLPDVPRRPTADPRAPLPAQQPVAWPAQPPWTVEQGPAPVPARPPSAPQPPAEPTPPGAGARRAAHYVHPPARLPTFADVGGMQHLKDELSDTVGLLLAFGNEADQYKISFNGILLHGPPGVGKTFIARAAAGEFGLHFAHISTGDLISKYVGESATNLRRVFAEAARHVPCLLFFDEFDSIAQRRDAGQGDESKQLVNQLLQSLEEWRPVRDLIIMAATNHLDTLDPAVVRPGRFDRLIRVDLPDLQARRAVLTAQLAGRPAAPDIDLDDLAERLAGRTPAVIARVVEAASMAAFRRLTAGAGTPSPIHHQDLRAALDGLGGADRPTVESWTWDRVILPAPMKAELRQLHTLVAEPDRAKAYGVEVPSGLLLAGPPGTGKTTVARVFAAQAAFSFYPVTAADLTSKWVGESEAAVVRLFERARANAPAVIFIDEIDALAAKRSEVGSSYLDRTLTQLLTEIDGMVDQPGVFVMAATNRPDILDPALLRGGRLSRTITIPLPDRDGRRHLLEIFTDRMPLDAVDLDALADQTTGFSGADLEALCQQAALNAMLTDDASGDASGETTGTASRAVTPAAFATALRDRREDRGTAEVTDPAKGHGTYL